MTAGKFGLYRSLVGLDAQGGDSLRISQPGTTRTISRPSRSRNRNLCPNRSRSAPGTLPAGRFWREWWEPWRWLRA